MITIQSSDGIATVTMNRPEQRNAMSAELVRSLNESFHRLEADADVRAIILTGAGKGFCAGSDLGGLARMTTPERQQFEAESGDLARLISHISKPVIAAVTGFAIGGGLTLAAACDIVVSQTAAKWSLPEVPIGLFPAWGLASVVERVGMPVAKRLCYGVEMLTGEAAYHVALVDFLVEEDPLKKAHDVAGKLAQLPPIQAGIIKEYFAANPQRAENADALANRLFLRAAATSVAEANFSRYKDK